MQALGDYPRSKPLRQAEGHPWLQARWPGLALSSILAGQCRSEQVVGGAVEVVPAAVVAPRGAWVGVAEGVLDVLQRGTQAQGFGGVGVAQAVRTDAGGEVGGLAEPKELLVGELVAVAVAAVGSEKDRSVTTPLEVLVEHAHDGRRECDAGGLAALARHLEHPVP